MTANFTLENQKFIVLNGGPKYKFKPSISFFVILESEAEVDTLWKKLAEGGEILMPFQTYDWSEKHGWLNDKYGVSWQIIPKQLMELMRDPDREKTSWVTKAILGMKKIDIANLRQTYETR